jgi:hypothetical protein
MADTVQSLVRTEGKPGVLSMHTVLYHKGSKDVGELLIEELNRFAF